jgi:hypothetical protein
MKKSTDTIGNQSRDLPVCSAVPQPLRHRVPLLLMYLAFMLIATKNLQFLVQMEFPRQGQDFNQYR